MAKKPTQSLFISILLILVTGLIWFLGDPGKSTPSQATSQETKGSYEVFHGCKMLENRGNDGDSFLVQFPSGREEIIRLGFVDSPESAFKSYGGGRSNHQRIAHQARAFGNIDPEQAVEIGKKAKDYAKQVLGKKPFTIYTKWEDPFGDQRYRAFVEVEKDGAKRFYHELLVDQGLVRIYTQGAELPDGTSEQEHKQHLYELERRARSRKQGAWGL